MLTKACSILGYNLQPIKSSELSEALRVAIEKKMSENMDNLSVRNMLLDYYIKLTKDKETLTKMICESKITITQESKVIEYPNSVNKA
jgi:hypothetical protein